MPISPDMREMVSNSDVYFGDQPMLSAPDYIGAIVIFLAVLGMFIIKNPLKWPLFAVCLLTIALGWGHNFMGLTSFFMDYVPGYNKFRAVSMIMIVPELILPLLAIMGLQELVKLKSWDEKIKVFKKDISAKRLVLISSAVVGGFCLISYLLPDVVNTFHSRFEEEEMVQRFIKGGYPENQARQGVAEFLPQIELARKAIFRSDALRSLIFILLALGTLYLFFTNRIQRNLLYASLGFFIFVDLWSVDRRYLNDKSFVSKAENQEYISGKTPADEEILRDKDPNYRVLNLSVGPFDDASTSFYHKSIGGYHGAKLRRYVDLIDFHLRPEINSFYKNIGKAAQNDSALKAVFSELKVINMLNTKYFIVPAGEEGQTLIPLKNPQANGNAWFVKSLKFVQSADSEIVGMKRMDTKTEAILHQKYREANGFKDNYTATGNIQLLSYKPNELEYSSESSENQFAVFSEIYYEKGWNVYLDGELKPHVQVNYVLRGMEVPAGKHTLVFRFEPKTYYNGNSLAMAGSILLLLSIAAGLFLHRRNNVIVS
ncbi:MAG: YfhO family protein [Bacteroidia bacterium]|nr:YfhO family protein [Bacteroidia bacterium]